MIYKLAEPPALVTQCLVAAVTELFPTLHTLLSALYVNARSSPLTTDLAELPQNAFMEEMALNRDKINVQSQDVAHTVRRSLLVDD